MKNLFFLLFFLTLGLHAFGQESEFTPEYPIKGHSQFGISIGSYSSSVTENGFSSAEDSEAINNFGFAVTYERFLSKNWGFKAGLNYDPKGATSSDDELTLSINYITLPILASWHFGKKRRWYLHFGPYFGLLTSADLDGFGVKELFNTFDSGFDFGIGIKIPIGNLNFYIESDGQTGFSDPVKDSDEVVLSRNTLSIGILF